MKSSWLVSFCLLGLLIWSGCFFNKTTTEINEEIVEAKVEKIEMEIKKPPPCSGQNFPSDVQSVNIVQERVTAINFSGVVYSNRIEMDIANNGELNYTFVKLVNEDSSLSNGIHSKKDGRFSFTGQPGLSYLEVTKDGFNPIYIVDIDVQPGQNYEFQLYMGECGEGAQLFLNTMKALLEKEDQ